jgi:hypothetical protein
MKVASLEMQKALIVALHTGQRQADILKLPWSAYDGQAITLSVSKRCARFAHIHQMHRRTMQNVGRDSAKLTNNTDHQDRQAIQEALLRLAVEVGD